ncbi:MAG: polysaccharide biosynthesis protein PslG, partial [Solirubrobacteraceae bacterium]|nr:polysaccharide biosynthesis protein PslG [Solirubrobacteraceae bacterium]
LYAASLARGIKPIFTLLFAPNWTWAEGQSCTPDPRLCRFPPTAAHDDAWKEFARRVAARYPQLAAIQVWNEPNIPTFWDGGVNPERYTAMLKLAHAAIKAENPSMEVLGGALANWWGDDGPRGIADRRFLARMYAAGAKGHMDGVSLHPYPADIDLWQFFKALTDLRTVRDNAGDSDAKIWITEVGLSTTYQWFTDNDQAAMLSRIYRLARAMPDVRGLIIHTLLEPSQLPETDYLFGYGVMRPEPGLQPKPAYCALAAATGSAYRCPEGVAVNPGPREPAQVPRWDAQELIQAAADAARRYKASHGSYTGLTQADLAALDSRLSAQPADYGAYPGPAADPSRIGIWVFESAGQHLLVCNTSRADRSYCIWGKPDGSWVQGMAASVIYVAAAGTLGGSTWWW